MIIRLPFLISFFVLAVVLSQDAHAQTATTYYVDPTCATPGTGLSDDCDGIGGDDRADNLGDILELDRDLVTDNDVVTIIAKGGVETVTALTSLDGWTTDINRTVTINCESTYRLEANLLTGAILDLRDNYVVVNDCHIRNDRSSGTPDTMQGINIRDAGNITLDGVYIDFPNGSSCGTNDKCAGIYVWEGADDNITIKNSVIEGPWHNGIGLGKADASMSNLYIDNNTIDGYGGAGVRTGNSYSSRSPNIYIRNNLSTGAGDAYENRTEGAETVIFEANYGDDSTWPTQSGTDGNTTYTVTTANVNNQTIVYNNAANNDYTLDASDASGAKTGGVVIATVTTDRDDNARTDPYSVGAYEFVVSVVSSVRPPPPSIFRE